MDKGEEALRGSAEYLPQVEGGLAKRLVHTCIPYLKVLYAARERRLNTKYLLRLGIHKGNA